VALILALIFRSFAFQPFHIPSGSMKPTLLIGDYLIVSKYSYGYSNHSFPFSPNVIDGRAWFTAPKRGDVVVFKVPGRGMGQDVFIKRLIGLPGDKIQVRSGVLFVNDKPVDLVEDGVFADEEKHKNILKLIETLPEGIKHNVLDEGYNQFVDDTREYIVPENSYFMMGDNRDNSTDSRFETPGFVPVQHLIGRADIILFSFDGFFLNPLNWRFERFFTKL
jgi:signal peptidase I